MKALRIVGGLFFLLFGFGLVLSLGHHLAHPEEPRHVTRLITALGLLGAVGYVTWTLFANAFRDPSRVNLGPGGGEVFGTALLRAEPDRLTLRPNPKARGSTLLMLGFGLVSFGGGLPVAFAHHRWVWFAVDVLVVVFDLFLLTFTLLRWRDTCVWDRTADLFTRSGVPVRPLSQIAGVHTERRQSVYHTILSYSDGSQASASPALTVFAKAEDADRFRLALQDFLGLAPPPAPVWPPPPVVPTQTWPV